MQNVEIRVSDRLDDHWSEWFHGFKITYAETNETILRGVVQDQAELYGIISKLRDLGLSLIAINQIEESDLTKTKLNL